MEIFSSLFIESPHSIYYFLFRVGSDNILPLSFRYLINDVSLDCIFTVSESWKKEVVDSTSLSFHFSLHFFFFICHFIIDLLDQIFFGNNFKRHIWHLSVFIFHISHNSKCHRGVVFCFSNRSFNFWFLRLLFLSNQLRFLVTKLFLIFLCCFGCIQRSLDTL